MSKTKGVMTPQYLHELIKVDAIQPSFSIRNLKRTSCATVLTLAYQSLGIVYGDLSTSPLYVYKTTFSGKLSLKEDDEEIFGVLSFIFWTFTVIALFKYVFIVMSADDNGEGGTFALYSLICRHARLSILPNQQATDEKLSTYTTQDSADTWLSAHLKLFFGKHPRFQKGLLIFVLLGTCMTIGDGVITPAISVSGVQVKIKELHDDYVVIISCVILVAIFSIQHHGTHRVAFMFAPVVAAWLLCIGGIGIYNIFHWNRQIYRALSPLYMLRFLKTTGIEGWMSLGGVVLSITVELIFLYDTVSGVEAMYADLVSTKPYQARNYFKTPQAVNVIFYLSSVIVLLFSAETVFWPVFIVATFAAVVGSQAVISATFSIVSQCCALNCFPPVKIVHTSSRIYGQIYVPEVNWILMCLCLAVTIGLRDTDMMGHAYGLAITTVMFVTTCLMTLVMVIVWKQGIIKAIICLLLFGSIELLYISASICKVPEGGWIPLVLSFIFMSIMFTWNYGTMKKHKFDVENKVSMSKILSLGPCLGMVRVPGIGIIFSNLASGVPAIFGHFVTNLPAFHQVLVFVCVKSVQVPCVSDDERLVISRIGPREYRMFCCIVRYGYKDLQQENYNFENKLVSAIIQFVEIEESVAEPTQQELLSMNGGSSNVAPLDVSQHTLNNSSCCAEKNFPFSCVLRVKKNGNGHLQESPYKDESLQILKAKESGVTYILGHSYAEAKKSSSILKKFAIDVVYAFLSKNCRDPDVFLNVTHTSLLEVGMVYHV
ncbi:Potassium transporter 1, partial [Mucuna pruriens]